MLLLFLMSTLALVATDVLHLPKQKEYETETPAKPYAFTYNAERYPGHADRQHTEVSEGSSVIREQYSYIDPRQKIRIVQYVADKQGFHPILNDAPPVHSKDTEAVEQTKSRHYNLYNTIAEEHKHPYSDVQTENLKIRNRRSDANVRFGRHTRSVEPGAVIEEGAHVDPGATVLSGANIKTGATIYDRALVRGGAVVGPNSIVESDAVVWDNAVMGNGAILRRGAQIKNRAVLGDRAVVNEGGIVMEDGVLGNDAVVGRNAVVGVKAVMGNRAVLRDGSRLPDGEVMGDGEVR